MDELGLHINCDHLLRAANEEAISALEVAKSLYNPIKFNYYVDQLENEASTVLRLETLKNLKKRALEASIVGNNIYARNCLHQMTMISDSTLAIDANDKENLSIRSEMLICNMTSNSSNIHSTLSNRNKPFNSSALCRPLERIPSSQVRMNSSSSTKLPVQPYVTRQTSGLKKPNEVPLDVPNPPSTSLFLDALENKYLKNLDTIEEDPCEKDNMNASSSKRGRRPIKNKLFENPEGVVSSTSELSVQQTNKKQTPIKRRSKSLDANDKKRNLETGATKNKTIKKSEAFKKPVTKSAEKKNSKTSKPVGKKNASKPVKKIVAQRSKSLDTETSKAKKVKEKNNKSKKETNLKGSNKKNSKNISNNKIAEKSMQNDTNEEHSVFTESDDDISIAPGLPSFTSQACIRSANKHFSSVGGKVTPTTKVLQCLNSDYPNSECDNEIDIITQNVNKDLVKRMAKANKGVKSPKGVKKVAVDSKVDKIMSALVSKNVRTPQTVKKMFRKKMMISDDSLSESEQSVEY